MGKEGRRTWRRRRVFCEACPRRGWISASLQTCARTLFGFREGLGFGSDKYLR